jgi:flagellar protein FlaG
MDVNAVKNSAGSPQTVASPVVPTAKPVPVERLVKNAPERPKVDIVELSKQSQVKPTENPLIADNNQNIRRSTQVFLDNVTNRFVVQVKNENNEVIRQLPSEEALRIATRFQQVTGLLFDQTT